MYLWTRDGLAQAPTLYGPLAGTLGNPPLPPQIQNFLKDILREFEFGKSFALSFLPDEIAEQILNSRVPETHYARLGKALRLMAEQRQKSNVAFKKRVEKERKKQGE